MWTDFDELPTTGEVARRLAKELGCGLTEGQITGIRRRRPEINPTLWRGRARWSAADVEALRVYLVTRGWAHGEAKSA